MVRVTAALMLFTSSGRDVFDPVRLPAAAAAQHSCADRELGRCRQLVVAMLCREEEMRLSAQLQSALEAHPHRSAAIYEAMQRQVAREAGFESAAHGVEVLNAALSLFPGDQEVASTPLYVRHNRSQRGQWAEDDRTPDIMLSAIGGGRSAAGGGIIEQPQLQPLSQHCRGALGGGLSRPVVLIAGSCT